MMKTLNADVRLDPFNFDFLKMTRREGTPESNIMQSGGNGHDEDVGHRCKFRDFKRELLKIRSCNFSVDKGVR